MVPGMSQVLSIAIAGAGIGGLTAAAFLAQDGHRVTVFDQFAQPQPVGSGLVIQPVGQAVLRMIGAEAAALGAGPRIHRMSGIEVDSGRTVLDVRYDRDGGPRHGLAIHRAALFASVHAAALAAGCVDRAGDARAPPPAPAATGARCLAPMAPPLAGMIWSSMRRVRDLPCRP